jgi:hypothetical protein
VDAERFQDAPDETVEEGERHEGRASPSSFPLVKPGQVFFGPFTYVSRSCVAARQD